MIWRQNALNVYQGKIEIALPSQFNHSAIICAGDSEKSDGTCPGDSGKDLWILKILYIWNISTIRLF